MENLEHTGLVTEFHKTTKRSRGTNSKQMIVMHYTAGTFLTDVKVLSVGPRQVSTHFVIGPTGSIAKIGNCEDILWHVGRSNHNVLGPSLNKHAIGIELSNIGILEKSPDGSNWVSYNGQRFTHDQVVVHRNGVNAFVPYPHGQLRSAYALCEALIEDYDTIKYVVGHEDVATPAGRKVDPGNGYIMPNSFYNRLSNIIDEPREEKTAVNVYQHTTKFRVDANPRLNVRHGPSTNNQVFWTFPNDAIVQYAGKISGKWVKVSNADKSIVGWVHSAYIEEI